MTTNEPGWVEENQLAERLGWEFLERRLQTELTRFVGATLTTDTLDAINEVIKSTLEHWRRRGNGRVVSVAKKIKLVALGDTDDPTAIRLVAGNDYTAWLVKERQEEKNDNK